MGLIAAQIAPSLADIRAALITNDTLIYDHASFTWADGDYTNQISLEPDNYIESDNRPGSEGAWIRQSATNIRTNDGSAVQDAIDARMKLTTPDQFSTLAAWAAASTGTGAGKVFATTSAGAILIINDDITIDRFDPRGAILQVVSGNILTLMPGLSYGRRQCIDLSAGGEVAWAGADTIFPEWFGDGADAVPNAFKKSYPGSTVDLANRTYVCNAIAIDNDPLTGSDSGKVLRGTTPAQRYKTTGAFYGARLQLAAGQNTDFITFDSAGANSWSSVAIENVMIDGNSGAQTAGAGIRIRNIKDIILRNLYIFGCFGDGLLADGANNQINLDGFIESFNNGRDGFNFSSIGDPQLAGLLRSVNNGRYGFYLGGGHGNARHFYAYFNTKAGFYHDPANEDPFYLAYLRSEDNDEQGAILNGKNLHIGHADVSDNNSSQSSTGTLACGILMGTGAANIRIDTLGAMKRTAATHAQKYLIYDQSIGGCSVGQLRNDAYGQWGIMGEQTALVTNNADLRGLVFDRSKTKSDTYANLKEVTALVAPKSSQWSRYRVTNITESMTFSGSAASESPQGAISEVELIADLANSASINLNWNASYVDASGAALSPTALTAGQAVRASFRRVGVKWALLGSLLVS